MTIFYLDLLTAQSMGASITSSWADVSQVGKVAVQAIWTGSPVGAIKLQGSNDGLNAEDIPDSPLDISGASSVLYNLASVGYNKVRIVYTRTSGSGALTANVSGKGGV